MRVARHVAGVACCRRGMLPTIVCESGMFLIACFGSVGVFRWSVFGCEGVDCAF